MSEYAIRKSDGKHIYIGSCEEMSCIKYQDRYKVEPESTGYNIINTYDLYWRLPVPDEDDILPGDYTESAYYRKDKKYNFYYINYYCLLDNDPEYFKEIVKYPGSFQMVQKSLGLLMSVKCYHGFKINDSNDDVSFGWNGKSDSLCLSGVKNEQDELKILIDCVSCNSTWAQSFQDIQHLIKNEEMKKRLFRLCSEYWEERNPGKDYPHAMTRQIEGSVPMVINLSKCTAESKSQYVVNIAGGYVEKAKYFNNLEDAFQYYINIKL